ncbi:hypothetical protein Fcan01_11404 [Folsomia candida]|uniref:Uncharacterized protein n=1 Tax=Folsomia candida TaxID=158441 RepID=A0A226E933_FOLCA|nr:hypothetical protein Fcan01_11404 [Folsomia candida]
MLLENVANCDIRIFHDKADSTLFPVFSPLPIQIFHLPHAAKDAYFYASTNGHTTLTLSAFDSCKSRLPSCAISILLLPESFTDLKDLYNWLYFSKHWFNYTQEASHDLGRGSINGHQLFHVLVSHHSNKIFSLIYAKNSYTGTIGLHNFGAIYASRDAIEFCVQQDSQQFDLSLQKCKIKDGNIHEMFVNLSRPPTYWDVDPSHNSGYNELFNISISSPEHIRNMISDAANETLRYGEDFGMAYAIKSCFSLLSPRKKDIYWNKSSFTYSFDFFHFLRDRLEFDLKYVLKIQLQSLPKFIRTTFNLFLPVHSHTPEGFPRTRNESNDINLMTTLVEKEITKCGKSVYVALTDRFEAEYDFLRRKHRGIRFHKGDDAINSQPYGYSFKSSGISKVPRCYRSLLESGIHTIVVQNEWREIHRKRKPCRVDDVAKESLLGGGLITLFMICGVLIACAVCAAAFENQNVIWAYIVNLYVFIRANIITSSFSVGNKKTRVLWVHYKS